MHYYQFNIGDYTSHTRGLSLLEDLAYRRLIDECYLSERPLNGCSTDVARVIGFVQHVDAVDYVLERFFTETDDGWVHERIKNDIKRFHDKQDKAAKAGKASAASRSKAKKKENPRTDVEQTFNECSTDVQRPSTNQEPITNNQLKDKGVRKRTPFHAKTIDLPPEVNRESWVAWCEYRSSKRKPISEQAAKSLIADFSKHSHEHQSLITSHSIKSDYQGWYPPKELPNGTHQPSSAPRKLTPAERTEQARQAALRRDATRQSSAVGAVETDGGNVWPLLGQPAGRYPQ